MSTLRFGLAGYGYWGPNLARSFAALDGVALAVIADPLPHRRDAAAAAFPATRITDDAAALIGDPALDAVVIATPPATHAALAAAALEAGKHVLAEKPLAGTAAEAARLGAFAARASRVLMVDHPHVFSPAVRALRGLVARGELGAPLFADAMRANLARFDTGIGVIDDLAVHDLAILDYVLGAAPRAVAAVARAHAPGESENLALLTLHYEGPLVAHVHANWLSPVKVRRLMLGGTRRLAALDDLEPAAKLTIHDRALFGESDAPLEHALRVGYRAGDATVPRLDTTEPLRLMAAHFVDCIRTGAAPMTGAAAAARLLAVVEAARRSIAAGGRPMPVDGVRAGA